MDDGGVGVAGVDDDGEDEGGGMDGGVGVGVGPASLDSVMAAAD